MIANDGAVEAGGSRLVDIIEKLRQSGEPAVAATGLDGQVGKSAAPPKPALGMDPEVGPGRVLDEKRERIDRHPLQEMIEPAVQKRLHFGLPLGRDRTGERHVETEFVEDIGVAPRGQVGLLRQGQAAAAAALELRRIERARAGARMP